MNRKRFMRCRLPRRCGAVLLAAALSLSMLGTGSAFADTTETGEEIVEMTDLGAYEASIDEEGGYIYYAYTPEESGMYSFYTTGDYDTYAYIYDADWNELDYDDDSGSSTNAKITISLEAGNTYYIAIRFYSSDTTGSFSVYAEKVLAAVSAELVLSQELVLYEGIDSYDEYDDNDEAFEYYEIYELNFTSGDQIVLTLEDGSTVTYTSYGDVYFYDENDTYLSFSCSSDQFDEHWEVGNTYYFTYTLTDYAIDVQIPVTIAENPYADATVEFISEETYTLCAGIDSDTYSAESYDEDTDEWYEEEYQYYYFWNLSFSDSDQIVITLNDGSTITYTADGYGNFYDEDGNYLSYYTSSDQYSEHWEIGGTYYYTMTLYDYGLTVQIPVTVEANPNDDDSSSDNSGTTGDDSSSADNSGTSGDGSTSDDDGSNGDISDDGNSSGEQDSGQTNGDSVKLKTQKITVKKSQLTKTIKYKKLKKKAQTFKLKASTSGNGKITYKKTSGNKKIKVSKAGKVTVKKGLKKGKTYKVKVKVTAAKTSTYKKATKTVTLKIKIK